MESHFLKVSRLVITVMCLTAFVGNTCFLGPIAKINWTPHARGGIVVLSLVCARRDILWLMFPMFIDIKGRGAAVLVSVWQEHVILRGEIGKATGKVVNLADGENGGIREVLAPNWNW